MRKQAFFVILKNVYAFFSFFRSLVYKHSSIPGGGNPTLHSVAHAAFKLSFHFPSRIVLCDGCALIVLFLTLGETDLDFHQSALQVHFKRHECESLLLDGADQTAYLSLVHEELPHAERVLVEDISLLVGVNVHAVDEHFPVFDIDPALLDRALAEAQGFDLRAEELNAGLKALQNKIVEAGFLIVRDEFLALFSHASPLCFLNPLPPKAAAAPAGSLRCA